MMINHRIWGQVSAKATVRYTSMTLSRNLWLLHLGPCRVRRPKVSETFQLTGGGGWGKSRWQFWEFWDRDVPQQTPPDGRYHPISIVLVYESSSIHLTDQHADVLMSRFGESFNSFWQILGQPSTVFGAEKLPLQSAVPVGLAVRVWCRCPDILKGPRNTGLLHLFILFLRKLSTTCTTQNWGLHRTGSLMIIGSTWTQQAAVDLSGCTASIDTTSGFGSSDCWKAPQSARDMCHV